MKRKNIFYLWSIILLMQLACARETAVPSQEESRPRISKPDHFGNDSTYTEPIVRILFVGNSLTYTNNLPAMVKAIGLDNDLQIETQMLAYPNYALEDHWRDGKFQKLMNEKYFNYVIVQQGPSSQQDGRDMLFDYGDRFKLVCDEKGARLVFFMVWPARANYQTFAGVIQNYRDAAIQTESILCPVGEAWKSYIDSTQDFAYYGADGFHPSINGSQMAAQMIYNTLFKN